MMKHFLLLTILVLFGVQLSAQDYSSIPTAEWKHGDTACSGSEYFGIDTFYTVPLLFQAKKVKLELENQRPKDGSQWLTLEVIYDDLTMESFDVKFDNGVGEKTFEFDLENYEDKNIGTVKLYKFGPLMDVNVNEVALAKTGKVVENMNDSELGNATYRPGDFAGYEVLRVPYPVAKPPFFMGVNSNKITITAYHVGAGGTADTAKLKVDAIDSDKAWRKEFNLELSNEPEEYTIEIDKNLETKYEGYFLILMPKPNSPDIVIRKIVMED